MTPQVWSGPVPAELDIRLQRRDTRPLPPGALIKFQAIGRGKSPEANYRWLLYENGDWFLAWHSGDTSDWQTPFDTELPAAPTRQLPAAVVSEVEEKLRQADFLAQPPYHLDETVEDGTYYVVTARLDDQVHEVIYEAVRPPLVRYLDGITSKYE